MNKTAAILITVLAAAAVVAVVVLRPGTGRPAPALAAAGETSPPVSPAARPKVLFVDSYHAGYPWSEEITDGVLKTFKIARTADGHLDDAASPVTLRILRMDTKRNTSEEFKARAGREARDAIESWQPDVVICADDNASQYLIVPFYRGSRVPFVFCGVNWDATAFGFPWKNVTGMLEVCEIPALVDELRRHARGSRAGFLGARNETNAKEAESCRTQFGLAFEKVVFVQTFGEWKQAYLELQGQVDLLILAAPSFLADGPEAAGDVAEARRFVLENTRIPAGSVQDWIAPYSLICYAKLGSEQGEWAAQAALRILAGTPPRAIPITRNHHAQVYLNMPLSRRLGVTFSIDLLERAVLISEEPPCAP